MELWLFNRADHNFAKCQSMLSLWRRLPIIVRAVIAGLTVAVTGTLPWAFLAGWNLRVIPGVPWAILPMALYLWLYWQYLNGAGWPRTSAEGRRTSLRANGLSGDIWGLSLVAGTIGLTALLPLLGIMSRLVRLPAESQPINVPSHMPFITVFLLLVMASIVAGVVEEAAFRGYMQGPIERQHGPIMAILVNGTLFGFAHYHHHPASVLAMLPFYISVAAVYGGLAYATNSILPGLVLHAGGDVFSLTRLWTTGQPEWQVSVTPPALIWETGADAAFLGYVTAFILLGAGAVWAYSALASAARTARASRAA
jgi:membrane protease YdiL (CAAX protease family)